MRLLGAPGHTTRNKKLLGAPGHTTRNKKLLGAPGLTTRSKDVTFTVKWMLHGSAGSQTFANKRKTDADYRETQIGTTQP